jgi:hypothetical protein
MRSLVTQRSVLERLSRRRHWPLALAATLTLAGCGITDSAKVDSSDSLLIVESVETEAGGSGDTGAFLLSDVVRVEDPAGVFNDNATITVLNTPKNANDPTLSHYNDVVLERYTVRYFRSDGRNTEGVDVPYSFQGPLSGTVAANASTEVALIMVRHQAKLEPPLSRLRAAGGADIISAFAEITLYGHTLKDSVVSVTATVGVTFADFGD